MNCYFKQHNIKYVDYKDLDTLKKFVNPHGRIIASKRSEVSSKYQRLLANAIKRARYMALLPYTAK